MEYVPGEPISEFCDNAPPEPARAARPLPRRVRRGALRASAARRSTATSRPAISWSRPRARRNCSTSASRRSSSLARPATRAPARSCARSRPKARAPSRFAATRSASAPTSTRSASSCTVCSPARVRIARARRRTPRSFRRSAKSRRALRVTQSGRVTRRCRPPERIDRDLDLIVLKALRRSPSAGTARPSSSRTTCRAISKAGPCSRRPIRRTTGSASFSGAM